MTWLKCNILNLTLRSFRAKLKYCLFDIYQVFCSYAKVFISVFNFIVCLFRVISHKIIIIIIIIIIIKMLPQIKSNV